MKNTIRDIYIYEEYFKLSLNIFIYIHNDPQYIYYACDILKYKDMD